MGSIGAGVKHIAEEFQEERGLWTKRSICLVDVIHVRFIVVQRYTDPVVEEREFFRAGYAYTECIGMSDEPGFPRHAVDVYAFLRINGAEGKIGLLAEIQLAVGDILWTGVAYIGILLEQGVIEGLTFYVVLQHRVTSAQVDVQRLAGEVFDAQAQIFELISLHGVHEIRDRDYGELKTALEHLLHAGGIVVDRERKIQGIFGLVFAAKHFKSIQAIGDVRTGAGEAVPALFGV